MASYQYRSLTQKHERIRILRLLPSKDAAASIECELFEARLDPDEPIHPYEALSYVWGNSEDTIPILADRQHLQITTNLHAALLQLRDPFINRYMWIDAICINQRNNEEKAQQIQLMHKIYSFANRVVVWLGAAAADDIDSQALEDIRVAAEQEHAPSLDVTRQAAISMLLSRPWFRRLWVLQEVAAARSITIICGSAEVDGHAFAAGLLTLHLASKDDPDLHEFVRPVAALLRGSTFRSRNPKGPSPRRASLGELIDMYHTRETSQQHDKIYALLSMSSEKKEETEHFVNYNKKWKEVLELVIRYLIPSLMSVEIHAETTTAMISVCGRILGRVISVGSHQDRYDMQRIQVRFTNTAYTLAKTEDEETIWTIRATAKSMQQDDLVCVLEGLSQPTIIRRVNDYFTVVAIATSFVLDELRNSRVQNSLPSQRGLSRSLLLTWHLDTAYKLGHESYKRDIAASTTFTGHAHTLTADGISIVALIHQDAGSYDLAEKYLHRAEELNARAPSDKMTLTCLESKVFIFMKRRDWNKADKLFVTLYRAKTQMYGTRHRDTLETFANHVLLRLTQENVDSQEALQDHFVAQLREGMSLPDELVVRLIEKSAVKSLTLLLCTEACIPQITDAMVIAAVTNQQSGEKIMRLFLEQRPDEVTVTERVVMVAAGNLEQSEEIMRLLLKQQVDDVKITEGVAIAAAGSGRGSRTLRLLLEQRPEEARITEGLVVAAAEHPPTNAVMCFFLEQRLQDIKITEAVVLAVASNDWGGDMMRILLEQRPDEVRIAEGVVIAVARTNATGGIMRLLLEQRPDEVTITEDVVITAAGKNYNGIEVMRILLEQRLDEDGVTEAVIAAAAGNRKGGEKIMRVLLDQRAIDVTET